MNNLQRPRRRCEGTAMGAIALDLRPGNGIGPFSLGMPICEAFAKIEQQPNFYDVVHVKHFDEDPLKLDIVITFPDHGFHLRFDPWSQRLRLIEIFDVKRIQMRYSNSTIGGPSSLATFVAVYALFGPTFPGIFDKDRGVYFLFYPGLSFAFPIPGQYTDCCHDVDAALPLEFPDGTTPVTCRVSVYDSSTDKKVGVSSLMDKASAPPLPIGSLYMEEVHVKLGEEIYFTVGGQHIPFGASPQDVWTELGRPCGIHQKQVDQMVIHSASDPRPRTTLCGDYFYNYFTRGLDILFDGQVVEQVEIEYVPERAELEDGRDDEFRKIFEIFTFQDYAAAEDDKKDETAENTAAVEKTDSDSNEEERDDLQKEKGVLNNKKKLQRRMKIAELKQICLRPDVVEVWYATAADPKLVFLKSYRNTVPVPWHWCQKRKFLQWDTAGQERFRNITSS